MTPLSMILISAFLGAMIGGGGVYLVMSLRSNTNDFDEDSEDGQFINEDGLLDTEKFTRLAMDGNSALSSAVSDHRVLDANNHQIQTGHLFVQEHSISDLDTSDDLASHLVNKMSSQNDQVQSEGVSRASGVRTTAPQPVEPPYLSDLRRSAQSHEHFVSPLNEATGPISEIPEQRAVMGLNTERSPVEPPLPDTTRADLFLHQEGSLEPPLLSTPAHQNDDANLPEADNTLRVEGDDHWVKNLRKVAHSMSDLPEPITPVLPRFSEKN